MKTAFLAAAVAASLLLGACSTTSPDVIRPGDAQRLSTVQDAVVLHVRPVVVEGQQSGVGGVSGAVIGNTVERFGTREEAVEILLQLPSGERRALVQAKAQESFAPGEAVVLVTTGGRTRVMKAPTAATAAQPSR